jgi:hypothetical protein
VQAASRRGAFQIYYGSSSDRDRLKWSWTARAAVPITDFGDPVAATDLLMCVYDGSGVRLEAVAPGGTICGGRPCWKARATGYQYKNKDLTPDGIFKIRLRAGDAGFAQVGVQAKGPNLGLPAPPFTTPVTVQLIRSDGDQCWSAVMSDPATNAGDRFKGRPD